MSRNFNPQSRTCQFIFLSLSIVTPLAVMLLNSSAPHSHVEGAPPKIESHSNELIEQFEATEAEIRHALRAARADSFRRLKRIGLAFHLYAAEHDNRFPPAIVYDEESGVARSWRVELLPYLDEQELYDQYRKNEPWDSEHNRKILENMPQVYDTIPFNINFETSIAVLTGPQTLFADKQGTRISSISDRTNNTILAIDMPPTMGEANEPRPTFAAPWTKPVDVEVEVDVTADSPDHQKLDALPFDAVLADGAGRHFRPQKPATLKALITPAGNDNHE